MEETELRVILKRVFEAEIKHWEEQDSKSPEVSPRESQQIARTKEAQGQMMDILEKHYAREGLRE